MIFVMHVGRKMARVQREVGHRRAEYKTPVHYIFHPALSGIDLLGRFVQRLDRLAQIVTKEEPAEEKIAIQSI
jgi:hypothetical protein